jgi:hypothetical protein
MIRKDNLLNVVYMLRDQILDRILMIRPCITIIDISFLASDLCMQIGSICHPFNLHRLAFTVNGRTKSIN